MNILLLIGRFVGFHYFGVLVLILVACADVQQLMFIFFSGAGSFWLFICFKEKESVQKIHYLMFVMVCLRALTLFTEAGMYHFDRIGGNPDGWNVAYYVFTFFRGIMFFTVIVLIGTGWSYLRPIIGDQEKKILVVVIPLQVIIFLLFKT